MKQFETIGKKMPYSEQEQYLDELISRSTETAIRQAPRRSTGIRRMRYSIAAALALLVAVGTTLLMTPSAPAPATAQSANNLSPIDQFLSNISDEEAQMLAYYDIEDIPEYE